MARFRFWGRALMTGYSAYQGPLDHAGRASLAFFIVGVPFVGGAIFGNSIAGTLVGVGLMLLVFFAEGTYRLRGDDPSQPALADPNVKEALDRFGEVAQALLPGSEANVAFTTPTSHASISVTPASIDGAGNTPSLAASKPSSGGRSRPKPSA